MAKNDITPSEIASALARVVAGETFRNAPQLINFLTFVVDEAVAGRGAAIKGYTIATQALGRPEHFDPQNDPIVRVEAGRLRRALDVYYLGPGRSDPIRIAIPRGTYVPRFERAAMAPVEMADPTPPAADPPASDGPRPTTRPDIQTIRLPHSFVAALVVVATILVILFALHWNETGWLARAVREPLPRAAAPAAARASPAVREAGHGVIFGPSIPPG